MAVQVGEFPGLKTSNRKGSFRSIPNPLDKATIISILPSKIDETKPTIFPGRFIIEPGTFKEPSILIVGPSSAFREMPNNEPILEIPNSAVVIADSVIKDYCNGLLGCDMEERRPGLLFVPGELTLKEISLKYSTELMKANVRQRAWFSRLVELADSLWARSNGNSLVIWDMMRIAAKELGFMDKTWLANAMVVEKVKCNACGGLRDPNYPICPTCKAIDKNHPLAAELKFAQ